MSANGGRGGNGRRVVVTGLGIVGPLGIGWEDTWRAALAGRSGAGPITRFDASNLACRIACEVSDFEPGDFVDRRSARRMDRASQMAVAAARLALDDAALEIDGDGYRAGTVIATGNGGSETFEEHHRALLDRGPERSSPLMVPVMIVNMPAGQVSMQFGLRGPAISVVTACASANHGIGDAAAAIRRGAADVMLAGGAEAGVTPFCMAGLDATRALSRRNDEPERASRPYDAGRDGFVAAEGAGVLVLESLDHARGREAEIVCEVRGYGASADAYHLTDPEPGGRWQLAAMRQALETGGLAPEELDYVNAHGTSTPAGDPVEIAAIRQLLGDERAAEVRVSSTKSMHGHGMGAAGGFEAVLTALAIREGAIPPTINLEDLDPACAGVDHVANEARPGPVRVALSNSFGFGGHNAVLAFAAMEGA
ncbi:MAG TPA: beta-ketoacyl-ACP synthase II [Miltoncostaeaceae bacterium]|nr:beta-ketoacyl-ACP synthase II [Miltoncostaeaceae bacterium]